MIKRIFRIGRFLVAGGVGAFTSVSVLFLLTHYLHLWYVVSSVVAFIVATTVSFLLQKFWTFKNREGANVQGQVTYFVVLAVLNLVLNTWLVYFFTEYAGFHYIISQASSSVVIAVWSFFGYKKIFK